MICESMLKRDSLTGLGAIGGFLYSVVEQWMLSSPHPSIAALERYTSLSRSCRRGLIIVTLSHGHRRRVKLTWNQEG